MQFIHEWWWMSFRFQMGVKGFLLDFDKNALNLEEDPSYTSMWYKIKILFATI